VSSIFDKRLVLVLGKGGVGRSTVTAALGAASARRGRSTLLFETNARDRYQQFFAGPEVGTEPVALRENLHAVNTNAAASLREYGLMVLRFERVYKMVFENRLTKHFLRAIPGLDDYSPGTTPPRPTTGAACGTPLCSTCRPAATRSRCSRSPR